MLNNHQKSLILDYVWSKKLAKHSHSTTYYIKLLSLSTRVLFSVFCEPSTLKKNRYIGTSNSKALINLTNQQKTLSLSKRNHIKCFWYQKWKLLRIDLQDQIHLHQTESNSAHTTSLTKRRLDQLSGSTLHRIAVSTKWIHTRVNLYAATYDHLHKCICWMVLRHSFC